MVNSPLALSTGGTLTATGALSVGDAYQLDGFHAGGRLLVNNHYVTLLDLNEAVLGASTVLGTSTANGTLSAPAGLLLGNGNKLEGRDGNDQLTGLTGSDRLIGGNGDDSYGMTTATTAETDTLFEAVDGGRDTVTFAAVTVNVTLDLSLTTTQALYAYMRLILNSATDFEAVVGGSGNDRLKGNDEANSLSGGLGNDVLEGAGGNDQLIGGSGDDNYIFRTAATAEADRVTESASSGIDTLDFSSLTTAVHLNLGAIAIPEVHSNRTLFIS